jgi:hypothetical protein
MAAKKSKTKMKPKKAASRSVAFKKPKKAATKVKRKSAPKKKVHGEVGARHEEVSEEADEENIVGQEGGRAEGLGEEGPGRESPCQVPVEEEGDPVTAPPTPAPPQARARTSPVTAHPAPTAVKPDVLARRTWDRPGGEHVFGLRLEGTDSRMQSVDRGATWASVPCRV